MIVKKEKTIIIILTFMQKLKLRKTPLKEQCLLKMISIRLYII